MFILCKIAPNDIMRIKYGFSVKTWKVTWIFLGINVFFKGSVMEDLIGIAVGFTYYFFHDILPETRGYNFLKTPHFFESFFSRRRTTNINQIQPYIQNYSD
jgi:hypothetical protein